ncbi:MAG: stage II sporulation protein M [Nanoarchaeota archaeon]
MFESLINPKKAERKPYEMFFIGLLYTILSILLANWLFASSSIFAKHIPIVIVFFIVNFSIPFMFYTIILEEKKDKNVKSELVLLREHGKALAAFTFLFLGFVVAFSAYYVLVPGTAAENFRTQIETYCQINSYSERQFNDCVTTYVTSKSSTSVTSSFIAKDIFDIFQNNFYVMLLSILFSFFFGAGAIFILTWNASVIGAAIGIFAKSLYNLPIGFLRFMIHGLPEIFAYFVAGLAGGIISVAIIRHDFASDKFKKIMMDALDLIIIAIVILFVSALIEVFITPLLF